MFGFFRKKKTEELNMSNLLGSRSQPPSYTGQAYETNPNYFGFETDDPPSPLCLISKSENPRKVYWYSCRETFHGAVDAYLLRTLWFSHTNDRKYFIHCFNCLEEHFDLAVKSYFYSGKDGQGGYKTNFTFVVLSPWWVEDIIRYHFLTIALRAAGRMTKPEENWRHLIKSQKYVPETMEAVEKFLDGNTRYLGDTRKGWVTIFSGKNSNLLTKPFISEKERKDKIAEIAYIKWQNSGSPMGQEEVFWKQAIEEHFGHLMKGSVI